MLETERLIQEVAGRLGPSVVGLGRRGRGGSGVVSAPGQVITLARNVHGAQATVVFGDGREAVAELAGIDHELDIAVLAVDTAELEVPVWAPTEPVALGTTVLALANPGGRGLRVTAGHVSSAGRRFRGPRGRLVTDVIEHTAPLPRGSGGGPLVDAQGRLLGINAVRMDGGLILALPVAGLRDRIDAIAAGGQVRPRRLGVAIVPPRAARRLRRAVGLPERDGLLVRAVEPAGPAESAGLERGDLIVAAAGAQIAEIDDLYGALDAAGDSLSLRVLRGVDERDLTVRLDGTPAQTV